MKEIISWLFKDPLVTVAWLNFHHKKRLRKIKFPQMNFFSWKTTNEIFMLLLALSFCKILKKFLELIQSYENVPFSGPKMANLSWVFLAQTIIITFIYLLVPFILENFTKTLTADPELWAQNSPFTQNENFSENLLISLAPFIHVYLQAKNQSEILIY